MRYTTKSGVKLDKREMQALERARELSMELARILPNGDATKHATQAREGLEALIENVCDSHDATAERR